MKNAQKGQGRVVIAVIIILLVAVAVIYFVKQQKGKGSPGIAVDSTQSKKTVSSASSNSTRTSQTDWKTYSNPRYGFSFTYPATWKLTEDSNGKLVTITSGAISDDYKAPLEEISFKATDKGFFTPHIQTKMGEIAYDENRMTLVDVGPPASCLSASMLFGDTGAVKVFEYGGSMMSDPAHSESAILTKNGNIVIVTESWETGSDEAQNQLAKDQVAKIAGSFALLNGNTVFIADCANQN